MKTSSYLSSPGSAPAVRLAASLPGFDYHPLSRVVFGAGTLARLGELARELGGTRVLLVTDPGLEHVGHPQRALVALHRAGLESWVFSAVEENPTTRHVAAGSEMARDRKINLLVAVGGGSSMDCAKGINFLYSNGGGIGGQKGGGQGAQAALPPRCGAAAPRPRSEGQARSPLACA